MTSSAERSHRKLIIDTDCGVDDAQALLCALSKEYEESIDILAITCVTGNVGVDQVCVNVLKVLEVSNRTDVPVYKGAYKPLLAHDLDASLFHGKDGLGDATGLKQPDMTLLKKEHAVDFLVRTVKEYPGEIIIVCLGPLTNIALACQMDAMFCKNVQKACLMGGNTEAKGNASVCGEFNFYFDPESAFIVLDELCCPVEVLTWEFCTRNPLDYGFISEYMNQNTAKSEFVKKISANTIEYHLQGVDPALPKDYVMCDQLAVAIAMQPDIVVKEERVFATVELQGKNTRGQMVIDWSGLLKNDHNISILVEVDMAQFRSLLMKSVH